jgi:hypothetical protein
VKKTTTVTEIEYDDNGRVAKETKTVTETSTPDYNGLSGPHIWNPPGGGFGHPYRPYTVNFTSDTKVATA